MKTLCIDFDGVIHDFKHPVEGKVMGGPMVGAKEALRKLSKDHTVVIFSVKDRQVIADFMKFYGLPYERITNIKETADVYVDDKALRFTVWSETLREIERICSR
jgi:predicted glycosyltransferase